jgi:hypothetical protein
MWKTAAILALAAGLGGCLTPSAFNQTNALVGRPLAEAVALYGPPDQPVATGAGAYSWGRSRLGGACELSIRTDASGRIRRAQVMAIGFQTCKAVLKEARQAAR